MSLEITRLKKEHINDVYSIAKEQFKQESWTKEQFEQELNQENRENYVLFAGKRIVAFAIALITDDECNLLYIATQEKYKKQGYGTILLGHILDRAKELKLDQVYLEVKASNKNAVNFYSHNGFTAVTRRKNYYKDGQDAILMFNYLK